MNLHSCSECDFHQRNCLVRWGTCEGTTTGAEFLGERRSMLTEVMLSEHSQCVLLISDIVIIGPPAVLMGFTPSIEWFFIRFC